MFKIEDVWNLISYFQQVEQTGNTDLPSNLDPAFKIALSEQTKATALFTNTIDQLAFNTPDYQRIRNLLIDWYAALRTLTSIQQQVSDPRVLTSDQLNELILSFGYSYGLEIISSNNRMNFFLDLVNIYKIKGTGLALEKCFNYYGLNNITITEYLLIKNLQSELVFRTLPIINIDYFPVFDKSFSEMTSVDPHWFITESQVNTIVNNGNTSLPVKTPYFSVFVTFDLYQMTMILSWISKVINDEYNNLTNLPSEIKLTNLNIKVSALECYLAIISLYNGLISLDVENQNDKIFIYNDIETNDEYNFESFTTFYKNSSVRQNLQGAADSNLENLLNVLSVDVISNINFLDHNNIGILLNSINPILYQTIQTTPTELQQGLLISMLQDFSLWLESNYFNTDIGRSLNFPGLTSYIYGIEAYITDINKMINLFKPYRSRFLDLTYFLKINNPAFDYLDVNDNLGISITQNVFDFTSADSVKNIYGDISDYSRSTFDNEFSLFDNGIMDDVLPLNITITQNINNNLNNHNSNAYTELYYATDSTGNLDYTLCCGGLQDFDSGNSFDNEFGSDYLQIYVSQLDGETFRFLDQNGNVWSDTNGNEIVWN